MSLRTGRRRVLWTLGGLSAAASTGLLVRCLRSLTRRSSPEALALGKRVRSLLGTPRELSAVGLLQIGALRPVPSVGEVISQLYQDVGVDGALDSSNDRLEQHLKDSIQADFDRGAVENVAGWLLSRTEARLGVLMLALERE